MLSSIRAAVERAVAHVQTWRMLSEEGGRCRLPIEKFAETLAAINGLISLRRHITVAYESELRHGPRSVGSAGVKGR